MRDKDFEKCIGKLFLGVDLGRTEDVDKEELSPDSYISIIKGGNGPNKLFAFYKEDAVFRLQEVTDVIEKYSGKKVKKYYKPIQTHAEPNEYYTVRPEGWDEIAEYAASDGIYYLFFAELE